MGSPIVWMCSYELQMPSKKAIQCSAVCMWPSVTASAPPRSPQGPATLLMACGTAGAIPPASPQQRALVRDQGEQPCMPPDRPCGSAFPGGLPRGLMRHPWLDAPPSGGPTRCASPPPTCTNGMHMLVQSMTVAMGSACHVPLSLFDCPATHSECTSRNLPGNFQM